MDLVADLTPSPAAADLSSSVLVRYPTTIELEDRSDALHWSVDPPESRADIREAVERGDLRSGSWRMVVKRDEWRGDVRHVHEIAELLDVSVATRRAYPDAVVELRSQPPKEERKMDEQHTSSTGDGATSVSDSNTSNTEQRAAGTLRVTERTGGGPEARTLLQRFQAAGWSPQAGRAEIGWGEFELASENRSLLWGGETRALAVGTVDQISQLPRVAPPLGYDQRYAWPAFPRVAVDSGVTSVNVLNQTVRTLVAGGTAVRWIDAVSSKPAIGGTVTMTAASLKQVASISSGIPNIYLENGDIENIISSDLRLSYSDGLDLHVCSLIAASSGTQTLSTDPLVNVVRRSISLLWSNGYAPDTLILTPGNAETIDLMMSGGTAGRPGWYTFGAGQFGPPTVVGLQRRISKNISAPTVVDSSAYGRLYAGPVSLQRFEENAGATNSSLLRFEGNALFNVERSGAAVRIVEESLGTFTSSGFPGALPPARFRPLDGFPSNLRRHRPQGRCRRSGRQSLASPRRCRDRVRRHCCPRADS